jgi:predicted RNase H-like HicB family nuclease/DNA-binding XRE family transcriptional regulator
MRYPAKVAWSDADRVFEVDFPDCQGCHTYGPTLPEALAMAQDALTGWIAVMYETGRKVPDPSPMVGDDIHPVEVEPHVAIPILIRRLREAASLTQQEVARRLAVTHQAYQRWERPDANITVRNLERVAKAIGATVQIDLQLA